MISEASLVAHCCRSTSFRIAFLLFYLFRWSRSARGCLYGVYDQNLHVYSAGLVFFCCD